MQFGLHGKSVLVMAGSQGIGLASACGFHAEGARVAICGRDPAHLAAARAAIGDCLTIAADVTKPEDIAAGVAAAEAAHGPIEILVVNAGGPPPGLFEALDDGAWADAVNLTLMSALRATRLVLPGMRARRWGRIVVISSFGVKQPVPGLTLSNSLRMAVLGWAKTLAGQVAGDGITVNTVCPGWSRTGRVDRLLAARAAGGEDPAAIEAGITAQIPLGRIGTAEEIANLIVFLGSDAASYVTGTAIAVDGGLVQSYA